MSSETSTRPPETVPLIAADLAVERSIVALCRRARAAGEVFGLDEQAALGLSAATYELARVLRELGAGGEVELGVGAGPSLQVLVDVHGVDGALDHLVPRLQPMVHDVTVSRTGTATRVRLATPIRPAVRSRHAIQPLTPHLPATRSRDRAGRERTLEDLHAQLQETNRSVVALYAELDDRAERLREAEDRLQLLLDSVQDYAICMLKPGGEVASWNLGAERLFHFKAGEIIGRHFGRFYPHDQREAGLPSEHLRRAEAHNRAQAESLMLRQGGTTFDAHVLITPVRGTSRKLRGFSLVVQDVTERRRLEVDLRRRADELEAANRAKEEFLATLSHELRTPLNAMLGWTRLLRMGKLDVAGVERALETIERNARLQEQLIADILDLSRIVTGKLRLSLAPLELAPVVRAAVDALRPGADAKGVRIDMSLAGSPIVLGDSDRLQQVVWNLLSNAIKFTPSGGVVRVSLDCADGSTAVVVTDTGEGMSPELLPFVFDRFRQGDASVTRPHGGLGLGLSIVRHLVELHGGSVDAASPGLGNGSSFTVRLPLRSSPDRAPDA